jgi:hypothetical protein
VYDGEFSFFISFLTLHGTVAKLPSAEQKRAKCGCVMRMSGGLSHYSFRHGGSPATAQLGCGSAHEQSTRVINRYDGCGDTSISSQSRTYAYLAGFSGVSADSNRRSGRVNAFAGGPPQLSCAGGIPADGPYVLTDRTGKLSGGPNVLADAHYVIAGGFNLLNYLSSTLSHGPNVLADHIHLLSDGSCPLAGESNLAAGPIFWPNNALFSFSAAALNLSTPKTLEMYRLSGPIPGGNAEDSCFETGAFFGKPDYSPFQYDSDSHLK